MQDASVCSLNLARVYCFAVLGKARAGKTNLIRSMIQSAAAKDAYICIMEFDGQQLKAESDTLNAKYIQTDEEMYSFLNELTPEFVSRNKKKHNLQDNGKFDKDLFEAMQTERQIFIFIEDLKIFLEKAYNPEEGVGNMSGFLENITDKGELHNIFIIASINMETASDLSGYQAYRNFIRYKTGILLGGPITDQRVFNFSSIPFVEASKALAKGVGLIADEHEDLAAQKVRIPQAGR